MGNTSKLCSKLKTDEDRQMIKMKKLVRSLVIALGGVFIAATASEAASISFRSFYRSAIDANNIFGIPIRPGTDAQISIEVNTFLNGIYPTFPSNRQVSISFSVTVDDWGEIGFPGDQPYPLNFDLLLPQNQIHSETFIIPVLNNLRKDGNADLSLRFNSASLKGDGLLYPDIDLLNEFGPVGFQEGVDFHPQIYRDVPEPSTMLCAAVALGWGAWLKRKNSSHQNETNL